MRTLKNSSDVYGSQKSSRSSMGFNSRLDQGSNVRAMKSSRGQVAYPKVPAVGSNDLDFFDVVTKKNVVKNKAPSSNAYVSQTPRSIQGKNLPKGDLPWVGCMPNCQHDHKHCFTLDYNKNHWDPLEDRPGYFKEFNEEYDFRKNEFEQGSGPKVVQFQNNNQSYDVCTFGCKGTPINLQTQQPVDKNFSDVEFKVKYNSFDPQTQTKYKEQGQQFQIVMEGQPEENVMKTSTISLFDRHIRSAKLFGLQTHFHSPSEHSIDGKLLDLEMHVVHQLDPNLSSGSKKSKFSHGVLGFLFKAVQDNHFEKNKEDDYHDKFLSAMIDKKRTKLDLTAFVKKLNYDKRWTYSGSLTTTPYSEGILWNVIEQVIPIRQSTLDKFLQYRKVEPNEIIAPFPSSQAKKENDALRQHEPDSIKPYYNKNGDTFFRMSYCNRVVQDQNDRPVYHIDAPQKIEEEDEYQHFYQQQEIYMPKSNTKGKWWSCKC